MIPIGWPQFLPPPTYTTKSAFFSPCPPSHLKDSGVGFCDQLPVLSFLFCPPVYCNISSLSLQFNRFRSCCHAGCLNASGLGKSLVAPPLSNGIFHQCCLGWRFSPSFYFPPTFLPHPIQQFLASHGSFDAGFSFIKYQNFFPCGNPHLTSHWPSFSCGPPDKALNLPLLK